MVVVVDSSNVEIDAEDDWTMTVVVVDSSGVKLGVDEGLEETISGVVSTSELVEGTTGAAAEDEGDDAGGACALPAPVGGRTLVSCGVDVTIIDEGSNVELEESCSLWEKMEDKVESDEGSGLDNTELHHDWRFDNGSVSTLEPLEDEATEDEDVADAVTFAVAVLIWRFT